MSSMDFNHRQRDVTKPKDHGTGRSRVIHSSVERNPLHDPQLGSPTFDSLPKPSDLNHRRHTPLADPKIPRNKGRMRRSHSRDSRHGGYSSDRDRSHKPKVPTGPRSQKSAGPPPKRGPGDSGRSTGRDLFEGKQLYGQRGRPESSRDSDWDRYDRGEYHSSRPYDERAYDYKHDTRGPPRHDSDLAPPRRHDPDDKYYSRRRTPPPRSADPRDYRSRKELEEHPQRRAQSPPRERSSSPDDFISALERKKSSKQGRPREQGSHRPRSPPRPQSRHDWPDDTHQTRPSARPREPSPDRPRDSRDRKRSPDRAEDMYGRGGPPRGGYYGQYPPQQYYNGPQSHDPYGRGYPPQSYNSHHGSPTHAYAQHSPPYQQYPQGSPYYNQGYPGYQQHYPPHNSHHSSPPHQYDPPKSGPRPTGPASAPAKTKSGHFANLSWTPNSRKNDSSANSVKGTSPPHLEDDDEDNPFRPPKDMRAEDEDKRPADQSSKPLSFTIKGVASPAVSTPPKPREPEKPRMVKEIVIRKRMKARPEIDPAHVNSPSVYYRKEGNESVVGSGTYGKVYKAIHVYTKVEVALKKIRMEGERDGFPVTAIREIKLLQSLNSDNVVKLLEVMVEKNDCYMIFEYASHDLTGLLNHPNFTLTNAHKKDLAKQMFEGLAYLHKRGVLHRDIKAANILVSKTGQLKLADFGLARFYEKHRKLDYTNRVVTIWYRSPELLLGETQYGPAVDVWSAACVLVEIFTKHAIFPGDGTELNQLDKIYSILGTPNREVWPGLADMQWYELMRPSKKQPSTFAELYQQKVTPDAFELLQAMFQYDPDLRPTAKGVLQHDYFTVEQPAAARPVELATIEGEWHEFESKALRKERDREARRLDKERKEKKKGENGEKRAATSPVQGEAKKAKLDETQ